MEKIPYYRDDIRLQLFDAMTKEEIEKLKENMKHEQHYPYRKHRVMPGNVNNEVREASADLKEANEKENVMDNNPFNYSASHALDCTSAKFRKTPERAQPQ